MNLVISKWTGAVLLLALLVSPAQAEKPRFGDTYTFSLGVMNNAGNGAVASTRLDLPADRLTFAELDLDDDKDILWASLAWQFSERGQLRFSYSNFDTKGLVIAGTSGNFEGIDWEAGAVLASSLDVDVYILDATWDLLTSDRGHLGIGAGVHAADLDFELLIGVFASVGGGDFEFVPVEFEEASVLAPLPNLALAGGYRIGRNVYFDGRVGWFSLNYDNYEGDLYSFRGGVEWRPWEHVGLGFAYQYVDVDVVRKRSSGREVYDLTFDGPILFVSAGF
ncbi:MAG: hypothetical protein ACR2QQ_14000 [Gammaproteobacteria bacterium]